MKFHTLKSPLLLTTSGALLFWLVCASAAPKFSEWSEPVNLGPVVNSAYFDAAQALSKDGLSLYFVSTRPGGYGGFDIWVYERPDNDSPWGVPVNLGPNINTPYNDGAPALSRDGHFLFFNTDRPGGMGRMDLWVSTRVHKHDNFGWQAPVHMGAAVNSSATEWHPSYFENDDGSPPQVYFVSNRSGNFDIYMSELQPGGTWGSAVLVSSLNSASYDGNASVRNDGLEVFLTSDRDHPGLWSSNDLFVSTRANTLASWSTPTNLGPLVNSPGYSDNVPTISADGMLLLFSSDRPGGHGSSDLYMSTRVKLKGPK
jgi:Tol biopolymer transport system component